MCEKKDDIKEIKKEQRGTWSPKHRATSKATDGTVGVSDWQESEGKAVQEARERVGAIQKAGNKK